MDCCWQNYQLSAHFEYMLFEYSYISSSRVPSETNSNLRKLFMKWCEAPSTISASEDERLFARIQEILTFVQFANDECDYGMGLEMGLDLFSFGHDKFHQIVLSVLPLAYKLLDRQLFAEISENHLKNRTDSLMPKLF